MHPRWTATLAEVTCGRQATILFVSAIWPTRRPPASQRPGGTVGEHPRQRLGALQSFADRRLTSGLGARFVASVIAGPGAIAVSFALWSCGDPGERNPGAGTEAPARDSLSADPIWAVGSADGPEAQIFSRISGARRLRDGSVVAGVEGFHEIRKFGPDGAHLWSVGRRGAGPGEFARLQLLRGCSEESVVAYDRSIFRVTEFSQDGERLTVWQLPSAATVPYEVTCAPDGRIIYFAAGQFPSEAGIFRWHVPISWISPGMQDARLIRDDVPGPERVLDDDGYWDRPWSRRLVLGGTDRGVWIGTSDDHMLELVGWDGTVLDTLAWSGRDRTVTQADIDQLQDEFTAGDDEEERARFLRESWPGYERVLPSTVPAYSHLLVLDDGTLWVGQWDGIMWFPRLPGHPGKRWDVFDASGKPIRQVTIPSHMRLLDAGADWVLVVVRDSLGVEALAVYEVS